MTRRTVSSPAHLVNPESLGERLARLRGRLPSADRPTITLYEGVGMSLRSPTGPGNPTGKGGGKRGKIKGWSSASRRRMRKFLLTHRVQHSLCTYGVTLTVPGPVDVGASQKAFHQFCVEVQQRGWCAVWRVEVQKRGALHWHLLMGLPAGAREAVRDVWYRCVGNMGWFAAELAERTARAVRRLIEEGEWEQGPDYEEDPDGQLWISNRMLLPGSHPHALDVQTDGGKGAWLRYLQDHATKTKQEQLAVSIGRHWGVVGRDRFVQALPDEVVTLDYRDYCRIVRWCQRLATPRVKDPRAPFGRRSGYRIRRGRWGESVWFSRVETVQRMMVYLGESTPLPSLQSQSEMPEA